MTFSFQFAFCVRKAQLIVYTVICYSLVLWPFGGLELFFSLIFVFFGCEPSL